MLRKLSSIIGACAWLAACTGAAQTGASDFSVEDIIGGRADAAPAPGRADGGDGATPSEADGVMPDVDELHGADASDGLDSTGFGHQDQRGEVATSAGDTGGVDGATERPYPDASVDAVASLDSGGGEDGIVLDAAGETDSESPTDSVLDGAETDNEVMDIATVLDVISDSADGSFADAAPGDADAVSGGDTEDGGAMGGCTPVEAWEICKGWEVHQWCPEQFPQWCTNELFPSPWIWDESKQWLYLQFILNECPDIYGKPEATIDFSSTTVVYTMLWYYDDCYNSTESLSADLCDGVVHLDVNKQFLDEVDTCTGDGPFATGIFAIKATGLPVKVNVDVEWNVQ